VFSILFDIHRVSGSVTSHSVVFFHYPALFIDGFFPSEPRFRARIFTRFRARCPEATTAISSLSVY
jgi:hypothetical protein